MSLLKETHLLVCGLAVLALAPMAMARVIRVPEDAPNVAAAVTDAVNGDHIDIASGVWKGGIDLQGKAILLRGRASGRTVLTGRDTTGPVISCLNGEGPGTVIEDLILRDGHGQAIPGFPTMTIGGGLLCAGASPTVRNCTFERNVSTLSGGGVYCGGGSNPLFEKCTFSGNQSEKGGAAICVDSSPRFVDCTFEANRATFAGGGIYAADNSAASVEGGRFVRNIAGFTGGGIYEYDAMTSVTDAVFDRNRATLRGGAAFLGHDSRGTLDRCHYMSPTDEVAGSRLSLLRPPTRGACALDRWCVQSEESDCLLAGGVYLGDHVTCSEQTVQAGRKRAGDVDFDGEVDDHDVALLMLLWR